MKLKMTIIASSVLIFAGCSSTPVEQPSEYVLDAASDYYANCKHQIVDKELARLKSPLPSVKENEYFSCEEKCSIRYEKLACEQAKKSFKKEYKF